jgi:hypothetical protein
VGTFSAAVPGVGTFSAAAGAAVEGVAVAAEGAAVEGAAVVAADAGDEQGEDGGGGAHATAVL